jgi:serine/threonine-protein kinase ATR
MLFLGLIRSLEACINDPEDHNNNLATSFPSLDMLHQFWQPAEQSIALPPGYQITVNKPNDACSIVLLLLLSKLGIDFGEQSRSYRGIQSTISWALDISHRIITSYWKLAKQRCIDRRKVVACISKVLLKILHDDLASYNIQPWIDLVAQAILLLSPSDSEEVQVNLARSIVGIREGNSVERAGEGIMSDLTAVLIRFMSNSSSWSKMIPDFQNAVKLYMLFVQKMHSLPAEIEGLLSMSELDKVQPFVTEILQEAYRSSSNSKRRLAITENDQERSSKRQKMVDVAQGYENQESGLLTRDLLSLLQTPAHVGLNALQDITQEHIANLKDTDALALFDALQYLPCAASKSLNLRSMKSFVSKRCLLCDVSIGQTSASLKSVSHHYGAPDCQRVYEFLCLLAESSLVRNSRRLRILFVQSIRRFINHVIDEKYLNLSSDPLGRYCMKSLQSSTRELRLSALQALMSYLREEIPKQTRYRNRGTTFELLKMLNTRDNLPLKETLIATWGLVGLIGGEEELNLALIELVNALGHPHPILCGTAFHEIRQLSKALNIEPIDLFSPFWRSIAPGLVKDVLSRPQKVQQLSDLLFLKGGVDELLVMTQSDTVPFLVVTKENAVLQRIAQARAVSSIQELIMGSSRTLANVLAKLLLECSNSERVAESLLQETVPNLKGRFVEVVRLEGIMTACEILKAAGDMDDPKKVCITLKNPQAVN